MNNFEKLTEKDSFSVELNKDENFEGGENQKFYDPIINTHKQWIPKTNNKNGDQYDIKYDGG